MHPTAWWSHRRKLGGGDQRNGRYSKEHKSLPLKYCSSQLPILRYFGRITLVHRHRSSVNHRTTAVPFKWPDYHIVYFGESGEVASSFFKDYLFKKLLWNVWFSCDYQRLNHERFGVCAWMSQIRVLPLPITSPLDILQTGHTYRRNRVHFCRRVVSVIGTQCFTRSAHVGLQLEFELEMNDFKFNSRGLRIIHSVSWLVGWPGSPRMVRSGNPQHVFYASFSF